MALLRARALRMLHTLSHSTTMALQSAKQPLFSSSANPTSLRPLITGGMQNPSLVSKSISFQWGFLNSNAVSSYSSSREANKDTNSNETRRKRPPADLSPLFPGRDDKHWLIIMHFPEGEPSKEEMIDRYVKTLATVVECEEKALKSIYSVNFDKFKYFGFGCEISKEEAEKLKGVSGVFMVFQDSWVDPIHKDYGGELFVDGKIVQRSPERQRLVDRTGQETNDKSRNRARNRARTMEDQGPLNLSFVSEVED